MGSFFSKSIAKHVLKENAENKFGTDDPYFEHIAAVDLNGHPTGKYQKRKRAIPPGLTKQEEKVLKKVTRRAYRLDNCLNICGVRVGWSAIVGLIPAAGDLLDAFMAFMLVFTATKAGIPASIKSRMLINIALDFAVGLVPFLGDIADAFFRCNTRNAGLLWKHLQQRGATRLEQRQKLHSGGNGSDINLPRVGTTTSETQQDIELQNNQTSLQHHDNRGRTHRHGKESTPSSQLLSHAGRLDGHNPNQRTPYIQYDTAKDLLRKPNKAKLAKEGKMPHGIIGKRNAGFPNADLENGDHPVNVQ